MSEEAPQEMTKDYLKKALKAFKKRLKLKRLDQESKLGGGAMTSGRASQIVAIRPPEQFPKEVWDKLVEKGRLRYEGNGLYELIPQDPQ
ncbi:MAG: hypothetical protein ACYTFG_00470 [Planctomycetota bacterium]